MLTETAPAGQAAESSRIVLCVTPILYWMLTRNGASPVYATILIVLIVGALLVQLSLGVLAVAPRLRSDIALIQRIDLTGAIARLIVLLGFALLFLNAGVAGFIKSQAANAVFYCLQGQITIFLISFFATQASAVAEVGALGRLTQSPDVWFR